MKRTRRSTIRPTMRSELAEVSPSLQHRLFLKAQQASWLAKCLPSLQARSIYEAKSRYLRQLVETGGDTVAIDYDRTAGLLSIGFHGHRLHTHERWLYPTDSGWRRISQH